VLQRYRAAIGGDAALKKHAARTETGSFEISGQGMKGDLKVVAQAPDKMHQWIMLPGLGNLEQGYDGTIGWSIDPAVGPRLLEGKELDQLKFAADFYQDLHDPAKYSSMTVVSRGPFEGEDCYEVRLVRTSGFELTEFFSTKTGLMVGVKMNATMQMGSVPVTDDARGVQAVRRRADGDDEPPEDDGPRVGDDDQQRELRSRGSESLRPPAADCGAREAAEVDSGDT
jgi:hypothetical protein